MKEKKIKILLSLTNPVISVNALYAPKISYKGRVHAELYTTDKAKKYKQECRDQFLSLNLSEHLDWLKNSNQFIVKFTFIFRRNGLRRDCSNSVKCLEDCWVNYVRDDLGISDYDDSKHVIVNSRKYILPGADKEYVVFEIEPYPGQLRYDITPTPTYVFLGGTCCGTTWRDELIPLLEKNYIKYFNPVVPDWTPECMAAEEKAKTEVDTDLYVLHPSMKGVFSVAEVIDSAYRHRENGFMILGILGTKEEWGEGMYRSLTALLGMVKRIGGNSHGLWINGVEDLLPYFPALPKPKKPRKKKDES